MDEPYQLKMEAIIAFTQQGVQKRKNEQDGGKELHHVKSVISDLFCDGYCTV